MLVEIIFTRILGEGGFLNDGENNEPETKIQFMNNPKGTKTSHLLKGNV
ncbi:MAG: hypothetical protein LH478_05710 [Chitinophagaceae bacterium]|nr:hypothetical protein [Chitinophagaceae bacterium]